MTHRSFTRLHPLFAEHDDVTALDLPGFGGLRAPRRDVGISEMADALAEVLDRESLTGAVVVGHSMGTQWAIELAVRRPDLVTHAVAIGAVVDDRWRSLGAQMRALAADAFVESPATNAVVFTDYARCSPRWYLAQLRHMLAYPTEERARMLTQPLLVVRGGWDPICGSAWAHRVGAAAARSRVVTAPRRPHHVQREAPRAVASAIRDFVSTGGAG